MKLFSEPFNLAEIEQTLLDDDFLSVAHFKVGIEDNWRDGIEQVARLLPLFEEAGRNLPIYGLVLVLVDRVGQFQEPAARLAEVNAKLGLMPRALSPAERNTPRYPDAISPEPPENAQ